MGADNQAEKVLSRIERERRSETALEEIVDPITFMRKRAEHTPGPWILDGRYILGPQRDNFGDGHIERLHIAVAAVGKAHGDNPEQDANARLIAAAPDILEALQHCLREHGGYTIRGETERIVRAAIAKALSSGSNKREKE